MVSGNPILTTPEEQFIVSESDFSFFDNTLTRCESGAFMLCRRGSATISVNGLQNSVSKNTIIIFLPGSTLMVNGRTEDFIMTYCAFSRSLFSEAGYRLDLTFFQHLSNRPISNLPEKIINGMDGWFELIRFTYNDRDNIFRNLIVRNRLQNFFLEAYDKMRRYAPREADVEVSSRHTEIFRRYMDLVHEHFTRSREVSFYADRLCISTRYLSTIVRAVADTTPKDIIDHVVLIELRMLLQSTDLSIQEIADKLHFPDSSYLGHFFKRHMGVSPIEYRNSQK